MSEIRQQDEKKENENMQETSWLRRYIWCFLFLCVVAFKPCLVYFECEQQPESRAPVEWELFLGMSSLQKLIDYGWEVKVVITIPRSTPVSAGTCLLPLTARLWDIDRESGTYDLEHHEQGTD